MLKRLRILLQGIGALALFLAIAAGVTYAGNRIHSSGNTHSSGYGQRVGILETTRQVLDPATGVAAQAHQAMVLAPVSGAGGSSSEYLAVRITLVTGTAGARFDPANFYLVDSSGQGYNAGAHVPGYALLLPDRLVPHETRSGWLGFQIPATSATYDLVWNDDSHLLPPARLARIKV